MRDFRKLQIWTKSHILALDVYRCTKNFPNEETYRLTDQVRRAAISIPTNIAEGCGKDSNRDFLRFLHISMGSASELEYLLQLSKDLNYLDQDIYHRLNEELLDIRRMMNAFIQRLKVQSRNS